MKLADLTGTSPMPLQSMVKKPSGMHPQAKHAFDLTNMEAPTYAPSRAEDTHFALQGRYPITDLVQVKEACAYFEDNYRAFHYEDRKEYAHNLCKRAAELGYDPWVPEKVKEYGGPVTATLEQVKEAFFLRQQFVRDDDRLEDVLNKVAEKLPYMTEVGRLQALQAFDKVASLERFYDVQLPDPYIALSQKWAAPAPFSEQLGAEIIREEELRFLASSGVKQLRDTFSDELVNRFLVNPVSTYKSLPKEQRVLMGRLAKAWEGSGKGMDLQASVGDEKKKVLTDKQAASSVGDYAKTFGEAGIYGLAAGAGLVTGVTGTAVGISKLLNKLHGPGSVKVKVNLDGHEKKAGLIKNTGTSFSVGLGAGSLMTLSALGIAGALSLRQNLKDGKGQEKKAVDAMHDAREVRKGFRAPHVGPAPKVNIGKTVAGVAGATIAGGALGLKGGMYVGDKIRSAYIKHKNEKKKEQKKEAAGLGAEAMTHAAMTITGGALGLHAGIRGGAVVMRKLLDASKDKRKD